MTVALVTGISGFVGRHLATALDGMGWQVVGVARGSSPPVATGTYVRADVGDSDAVSEVVASFRPDVIFHLAAPSRHRSGDPGDVVRDITSPTLALCEAIRHTGVSTRLVLAGSSAQYGRSSDASELLTEDAPCLPTTAYGYAKLAAESLAFALSLDGKYDLIAVRPFNHVGPGEPPSTVAGAFAARILDVLAGRAPLVEVSDLDAVRDFTDVRDVARGYVELARSAPSGAVYNLCSGHGTAIGDILDGLLSAARLDRTVVHVSPTLANLRRQVGSPVRAHAAAGWRPEIPLTTSLRDLLYDAQRSATGTTTASNSRESLPRADC